MLNRPFTSTSFNVYDEKTSNSTPTTIFGQKVLVSQEQHQKVFNTLTTSIAGYPTQYQPHNNAITFTFANPRPQNFNNLQQLQQSNAQNLIQLQSQLCQPCQQWRFHLDSQTSTSDLGATYFGRPDLANLAGFRYEGWPYWLETPASREHKKLILNNVSAKLEGHVYDEEAARKTNRKVCFEEDKKDGEVQVKLCCDCINEDNNKPVRRHKKKKKKRSVSRSSSSGGSNSENDPDLRKL